MTLHHNAYSTLTPWILFQTLNIQLKFCNHTTLIPTLYNPHTYTQTWLPVPTSE